MKLICILGRCFATINVSSISEFHFWNPSPITTGYLGVAQWAHNVASAPCISTATCPTGYGIVWSLKYGH